MGATRQRFVVAMLAAVAINAEVLATARNEAVDQAEQALIDWMRNTSGARERLGAKADEVFRLVDEARTTAIQRLMRQNPPPAQPRPPGLSTPMIRTSLPSSPKSRPGVQGRLTGHILGFLAGAPWMFPDSPRDEQGNRDFPPSEFDATSSANVHTHVRSQARQVGSRIEAEIEMTISTEIEGLLYEERAAGRSRVDMCPDAAGGVRLELTLHRSTAAGGGGTQYRFTSQGTGHVDDDANLTSYDIQTQAETARQPAPDGRAGGEGDQYLEWTEGYTLGGLDGKSVNMSGAQRRVTRQSSNVDQKFREMSADLISNVIEKGVTFALKVAETKWQGGFCVEVSVPEIGSDSSRKTVAANSETPFTALVRHKFERKELAVGVIAKLTNGAVSVSPAGSKVPAPASFRFKAPAKSGQSATVELESRSKRGVGRLTLLFLTKGYRVDQSIPYGTISGSICTLDRPFALRLYITLNGANWIGEYRFTPADERGGTWSFDGDVRVDEMTGHIKGTGAYKVEGTAAAPTMIKMDAAKFTVTFPEMSGGSSPTNALTLTLEPADDGCPEPPAGDLVEAESHHPPSRGDQL